MEGSRLWDRTSRGSALFDRVDGALCVSSTTAEASRFFSSSELENPPTRRAGGGDVAARNALMVLQPGSAACNDPAALGVLLAPNFCWLSVGWCRLLEGVLAHAQPSVSPFLCAASQCLGRCGRGRVITAAVTTTLMCYAVAGGATHSSATSCFDVF
ncbi:hypothetical protein TcCL_Unassigned02680 [Trypanosoma cruzi]|nr:hypothetical protein TcCL_Unassigned02680 [Trypanosoma cruzi]